MLDKINKVIIEAIGKYNEVLNEPIEIKETFDNLDEIDLGCIYIFIESLLKSLYDKDIDLDQYDKNVEKINSIQELADYICTHMR